MQLVLVACKNRMDLYVNPENVAFRQAVTDELYIDKMGMAIEKEPSYHAHLNQYNVIRPDIQRFLFQKSHCSIFN